MRLTLDERDRIANLWRNHKTAAKGLKAFAQTCAMGDRAGDIIYIIKIDEAADRRAPGFFESRVDVFTTLRDSNIASPSMSWPYLSIASEGSLAVCRLVVPKLLIWDFNTGKRLN